MSQILAARSACSSAVTTVALTSSLLSSSPIESSLRLNSSSRLATKLLSSLDPNFLCKLDLKDDFLLPSLDDEELRLLE